MVSGFEVATSTGVRSPEQRGRHRDANQDEQDEQQRRSSIEVIEPAAKSPLGMLHLINLSVGRDGEQVSGRRAKSALPQPTSR